MAPPTMDMVIRTQLIHVTPQIIRRGTACCIEYLAKPPDLDVREGGHPATEGPRIVEKEPRADRR
jgi:hypothetical protein